MEKIYFGFLLFAMIVSIGTTTFEFFHCKAATCHEFNYGFKNSPHRKEYLHVCYDTMKSLQNISQTYGKCLDQTTKKFKPTCILALATTMQNCVRGLSALSVLHARYYCGYRLMQNCAKHVGLDRFPYRIEYQRPEQDK